jgi:hypothetical protein
VDALHKRRNILKTEAFRFQEEGLIPLEACYDLIAGKLKSTKLFIEEGNRILRVGGPNSPDETIRFSEKASQLGRLVKFKANVMSWGRTFHLFRSVWFGHHGPRCFNKFDRFG